MTDLRVGIIGAGFISQQYSEAIQNIGGCRLVGIFDEEPAAMYSHPPEIRAGSVRELCNDATIDCICVLTPHDVHAEQIGEALQAGKHVISEKPLALTLAETEELRRHAAEAERHLICRQYLRHAEFVRQIESIIRSGSIGPVRSIRMAYVTQQLDTLASPTSWRGTWSRAGGGVVMDLGFHPIDLLNGLFGSIEVRACVCERLRVRGSGLAEDYAVIVVEAGQGTLAQISLFNTDTSATSPTLEWEFLAERGRVTARGSWDHVDVVVQTPEGDSRRSWRDWWSRANQASVRAAFEQIRMEPPDAASVSAFHRNLATVLDAYSMAGFRETRT